MRRIEQLVFYGLILTCPLELGKSWFYQPFEVSGPNYELRINIPIILLALLALSLVLHSGTRVRRIQLFGYLTVPTLLFLAVSAISCIKAPNLPLALFELFRMVTAFLIYFVVANYVSSEAPAANTLMIVIAITVAIHGTIATVQYLSGSSTWLSVLGEMDLPSQWGEQELARAGGLMGHPNSLASLMLLLVPVAALYALFATRLTRRCIAFAGTAVGIVTLLITYSRSAWVALPLGVCVTAPSTLKLLRECSPKQKCAILAVGVALMFILAMAVTASSSSILERIEQSDEGSAHSRVDMMIDAVEMIKDNYIAGVGLNNYSVVIPKYDITGIHRAWKATTVHNLFLLIAAETGLASMLLFIVIMYRIVRAGGRVLAACRLSADVIFVAGLRLGIVCFLIVSTVDPAYRFYPGLQRTLWLTLGLLAGYVSLCEHGKPAPLACSMNRTKTRVGLASHSHV